MTYRSNSRQSLAFTPWDDYHKPPAPKLREPENPKSIEVIDFKITDNTLNITFYREGILKEEFNSINLNTIFKWAITSKEIQSVYEIPYYDKVNDEEYIVIYPYTSESGTAEEINNNRFMRWLNELTNEGLELILKHFLEKQTLIY